MTDLQDECAKELADGSDRLRDLVRAVGAGFPQDSYEEIAEAQGWAKYFGIDLDDPDDPPTGDDLADLLREAHEESILGIDRETVVSVVYGTGGPHHEVAITFQGGEPIRGEVRGYWAGDEAIRPLDSDEVGAYVEAMGLTEQDGSR